MCIRDRYRRRLDRSRCRRCRVLSANAVQQFRWFYFSCNGPPAEIADICYESDSRDVNQTRRLSKLIWYVETLNVAAPASCSNSSRLCSEMLRYDGSHNLSPYLRPPNRSCTVHTQRDCMIRVWVTHKYTVSQKTVKIVFVRTSSNFHQLWQFLAQRWQRG